MLTLNLAIVLIVALVAFAAAWRWMPPGWLTASTGSASAVIVAFHEAANEQMPVLKAALPEEYRPVLVIMFLLLTVAARFATGAFGHEAVYPRLIGTKALEMIPQLIVSLIGGPVVNSLLKGYRASLDAANTSERIAADLAIKDIEAGIEARAHAKEIRMATAGFWEMRLLTFAIAFPFVSHLWAVWLDTQFRLGWGIPKFPEPMNEWQGAILLSFFGIYTLGKTLHTVGAAIAMRRR